MDLATVLGIVSAFGLIFYAILSSSGLAIFIDVPSVFIVVGGTFGITLITYPLATVLGVTQVVMNVFFVRTNEAGNVIPTMVDFAGKARRDGILALESAARDEKTDHFLAKGVQLAVDGLEPRAISSIMEIEIEYLEERHGKGAELFTTMGTISPAMGLIGTLVGLVQMLQNLSDPSSIGPAMAVALLTTFYGAILANMVFLPISGKLKTRHREEILGKQLMLEGIMSIASGDNPRTLEQKLHSFIAPGQRKSSFD
ncbi:MAG: MotA/TolQ/ExbB proton channel family protein [bacterium]